MKAPIQCRSSDSTVSNQRQRAFTLVEVMISMTIFIMLIGGVLASHLIGLRLFELSKAKLGASDDARQGLSLLFDDVRSAKDIQVGIGNINTFTECADGTLQQGNSIRIFPSTNQNTFIQYYLDTDSTLKRMLNTDANPSIIVNAISNNTVFASEDHFGGILTNNQNNRVIGLTVQIYQLQYPRVDIGPGQMFDFYQLRSKMTRRTLE